MSIIDESGSTWVTAFNDQAEKLLGGVTAKELFEMRNTDNTAAYDKVFADCLFKPFIAKVNIEDKITLLQVVEGFTVVMSPYYSWTDFIITCFVF